MLSCGIDAAVNARANGYRWPKGSARYVRALAGELGRFRPFGYRVTYDGQVWESAGTVVAVANTRWFGGGVKIAPDAAIDDGLLDVVVAGPFTKPGVVTIFPGSTGASTCTTRGCRCCARARSSWRPCPHSARCRRPRSPTVSGSGRSRCSSRSCPARCPS